MAWRWGAVAGKGCEGRLQNGRPLAPIAARLAEHCNSSETTPQRIRNPAVRTATLGTRRHLMEDLRRRIVSSTGGVEFVCTLCEDEGRPHVIAGWEYVVVSTLTRNEIRVTVCPDHADQLDRGTLAYNVVKRRKGPDWAHPL